MRISVKSIILVFLMLALSFSVATNSLNGEIEVPTLEETAEPLNVILPASQLNIPGHQEGSIFSDTTLSSGDLHTCAILDNGSVSCWGDNSNGQLGDGTNTDRSTPTQTLSLGIGRTAVAISSGGRHTCAILDNGSVSCWGSNSNGRLGDGTNTTQRNTPTQTSSLGTGRTAVAISSGAFHTCAILDDASVSCWGRNSNGQLGDGTNADRSTPTQTSSLGTGRTAVAISSEASHTCAILDDAFVSCWGYNYNGELGDGTNTDRSTPTQTSSLGIGRTAVAISSGGYHTCALLDDASVSCWGLNTRGQLGDGTTTVRKTPAQTSSLGAGRTAVAISSGGYHTCAILDDGTVSCWGRNDALGFYTTTDRNTPTQTSSQVNRTAVAISSGTNHVCAILDDGSVSCWGQNGSGRLGDGTTTQRSTPTQTSSLGTTTNPRTVALSERDFDNDGILNIFDVHQNLDVDETTISTGGEHTCAILDYGSVSCWGRDYYGQLGNGLYPFIDRKTPTQTSSLGTNRTAVAISSGESHTCAILDNGSVSCWGSPSYGKLGDGTNSQRVTPTQTSSLGTNRTAVAISSGIQHTCAVLDDGSVSCWGKNEYGRLGDGTTTNRNIPTQTSSLGTGRTAVAISSGDDHTCALLDDGSVSCWGQNDNGQIGDGTTTNRNIPTQTSSLGTGITAVAISSGNDHTCALLDDGSVSCWGSNYYGQTSGLGTGTGRTAVAISSGYAHTCAILDDGTVSCWGGNWFGQLGDGTNTDRSTPTQTSSLGTGRTAVAISSGEVHTCAVLDNASVSCWGRNTNGRLGDGTYTDRNTPTPTSSLGTNRTALLVEADRDGDGTLDYLEDYPNNSIRSIACTSGQYGRYLCVDSPVGKYVPLSSAMYATDCLAGTYQTTTGQSSCDDADAGYYVPTVAQSSQTACATGTYQALTVQSFCNDADAGYYVPTTAQSNQTECGLGTYQALTGQSSCNDADAGHYVNQTTQTTQTECGLGTYQALTGQSSCDDADAGYYVSTTAQSGQTECGLGTYQVLTRQSFCDDADAGYYVNQTTQTTQTECGLGTYQALTGQSSCNDADAGYYVNQTTQTMQTECSIGTYQVLTGQSSCDDADAGYYVNQTAQTTQTECSIGTYQSLTVQSSCNDSDVGYYVGQTAQINQTECGLGTYQALTGQSSCNDADAGHYVNQTTQTIQTECGLGTYQALTGQSSCDDADYGYYVNQTTQTTQTECSIGTYQVLTGQSSCDDTNAGYYVATTAQTNQTECSIGTYQTWTGQSSCDDADAGYYVNQTAQTTQTECAIGTYQSLAGQGSCDDADAGYYVNKTTQTIQIECGLGTYQVLTGQSSCDDADAGYYVDQTTQTNQTECGLGTYQALTGQTSCDKANTGYYVDSIAAEEETPCPNLKSTIGNYSVSESDCLLDIDSDLIPDIIDNDDDNDGINDTADRFPKDVNEWNDSDFDGTGDNEDTDDDNDGWSDVEEIRAGTDPYSNSDQPIEGFEVIIPGTSISLGAWDLIGMLGGIPLFVWISFGFVTRNSRALKFETRMKEAKNKDELDKIAGKVELSLTVRLLGVNQGIRLDKIRAELEETFSSEQVNNGYTSSKIIPVISNLNLTPDVTTPADQVDAEGYEWLTHSDGSKWYRVAQSNSEWTKFE
jgi:alpha-tubulin suppressor-like RCC1 family protein